MLLLFYNPFDIVVTFIHAIITTIVGFTHDYAWGLILLSLIIKIILWPCETIPLKESAKIKKLTPQIENLKRVSANNEDVYSSSVSELFNKNRINPKLNWSASAIQLVVQAPILLAIYYAILKDKSELTQKSWFWIQNTTTNTIPHSIFAKNLAVPDYALVAILLATSYFTSMVLTPNTYRQDKKIANYTALFSTAILAWFVLQDKSPSALLIFWNSYNAFQLAQKFYFEKTVKVI